MAQYIRRIKTVDKKELRKAAIIGTAAMAYTLTHCRRTTE
jgi:hypothetical protein